MLMLDTVAMSDAVRAIPTLDHLITGTDPVVVSSISAGEILFGIARRPERRRLARAIRDFLDSFDVLPWTQETAEVYARTRADCERRGRSIGPLDLLIAAHALSVGARLVTRDRSFASLGVAGLAVLEY